MPGLTREEGVFLVTAADDGSRAVYFIAQNTRHSILSSDVQLEQQLNPLWPVRSASRDEVLAFAEAAPIGTAKTGLIAINASESVEAQETAPESAAKTAPEAAPETAALTQHLLDARPIASGPTTYILQPGDNLTRIGVRYATSVQAILAANGIANANRVLIGQPLVIPGSAAAADVVESPAAPAPIAADAQETVADAPADDAAATTYTVIRGDSAIAIARKFGVDVDELLATNSVVDRNRVYAGQILSIPQV